jgi:phosphoglucosamine mutase
MPERLFGTDGIRGPAGVDLLAPPALARLGLAVARTLPARPDGRPRRALIGRDTRLSGPAVTAAVTAGLLAGGVEVHDGGVLPTPAVALLGRRRRYDVGVVVSASHNPWPDNGVKLLGANGRKLDDEAEAAIEAAYADPALESTTDPVQVARPRAFDGAVTAYENALLSEFRDIRLRGLHVVVDPGHGAQSAIARRVLRKLGARVTELHAAPDGRNINEGCGALHPATLRRTVKRLGADAGVAFDGDADRVQLVDEKGRLLDGDVVLAALAPRLAERRRLPGRTVVGTLMTNAALEQHLAGHDITLLRTPVGDRHVVAAMTEHGYGLGGEPSGHLLIPRRGLLTGDGLVAAVACLRILADEGITASQLAGGYRAWPLEIVSFRVRRKPQLRRLKRSWATIREVEERFADRARIVVRYSGTEPKVRVMVEARRRKDLDAALTPIVDALRAEIGA